MTDEEFQTKIRPFLKGSDSDVSNFLSICSFFSGSYDSDVHFSNLSRTLNDIEAKALCGCSFGNRLFYFAVPPNVFIPAAAAISRNAQTSRGWNRIVVEKPFGHDLQSALEMSGQLRALWNEDQIYRIDHYLGKEMVQNLTIFRFGNTFLEPLLNNRYVSAVKVTFKEDFGTMVAIIAHTLI